MKGVDKLHMRDVVGGVVISVKVTPGSSRDRIIGVLGDCLKIATASPAEKGRANAAIAETLATALGLDPRAVTLHSGRTHPRKEFFVAELTAGKVRSRLERL